MDEPTMQVIREMTQRVHALHRARAAELEHAANHREHGDYTRAAIAAHAAQTCQEMAGIYRQAAGVLSGTWLPSPDEVTDPAEGLGMAVGIVRWGPPQDATPAQIHQWKAFSDTLHQVSMRQKYRSDDVLPAAHETQMTGPLPQEDLPQPDALTASPAEVTGAHAVAVSAAGPPPDFAGFRPAPDVQAEPDASAECGRPGCGVSLIRLDGAWLHSGTLDAECRPGQGAINELADPVNVVHRDPARQAEGKLLPEPVPYGGHVGQRVLIRTTGGDRSRGTLHAVTGGRLVLDPCEMGQPVVAVADVGEVSPVRSPRAGGRGSDGVVDRVVGLEEQRAYPDRPVVAPVEAERASGGDDVTEAFPPVAGDGGRSDG